MNEDPYVVLEWASSSSALPSGEPTDYVYEYRGDLVDVGESSERTLVGRFGFFYMDLDRATNNGMPWFDVFDTHASTISYYEAFYDVRTGHYSRRITNLLGCEPINSNALILDRLEILPKYRGKKLGLRVLRPMIERFSSGPGVVALKPFPLQLEGGGERNESDEWRKNLRLAEFSSNAKSSTRELMQYYATLGFEKLRGTAFMISSNDFALPKIGNAD